MKPAARLAGLIGAVLLAGAARAEPPAPQPCAPRAAEKLGVRFAEVCGAPPAFWLTTTPAPCTQGDREAGACAPVTALAASPLASPAENRPLGALLVDAATAQRTCSDHFGGRLPTRLEREQARAGLALASLLVREAPGGWAKVWLDELPEWVGEGDCAKPGPACRIEQLPPVLARPRSEADVLLACVAEPAAPQAFSVTIGGDCYERPQEGGVRSPDCAVRVPGTSASFELECEPAPRAPRHALPDRAAFRCVLPERALKPQRAPRSGAGSLRRAPRR